MIYQEIWEYINNFRDISIKFRIYQEILRYIKNSGDISINQPRGYMRSVKSSADNGKESQLIQFRYNKGE